MLELSRVVTDEAEGNNTCAETFELVGILGIAESLGYYIVKDQHHLVVEENRRKRASTPSFDAKNSFDASLFLFSMPKQEFDARFFLLSMPKQGFDLRFLSLSTVNGQFDARFQ